MNAGSLVWESPIADLRGGIKRLRVGATPATADAFPFTLLARQPHGREEVWVVRDWNPSMRGALAARGVDLIDVIDLDLEECYLELLRTLGAKKEIHAS
jgi:hypothetical protein